MQTEIDLKSINESENVLKTNLDRSEIDLSQISVRKSQLDLSQISVSQLDRPEVTSQ